MLKTISFQLVSIYCMLVLKYVEMFDKNDTVNLSVSQSNRSSHTHIQATHKHHTAVVILMACNKLERNILLFPLFPTQHMSESA